MINCVGFIVHLGWGLSVTLNDVDDCVAGKADAGDDLALGEALGVEQVDPAVAVGMGLAAGGSGLDTTLALSLRGVVVSAVVGSPEASAVVTAGELLCTGRTYLATAHGVSAGRAAGQIFNVLAGYLNRIPDSGH